MEKGEIPWKSSRGAIGFSWLLLSLLLIQACNLDITPERVVRNHYNIHLVIDQTPSRKKVSDGIRHDSIIAGTVIDFFVQHLFSRNSRSSLSYEHFTNSQYFKDFPTISLAEINGDSSLLQRNIRELRKHIAHFCNSSKEHASGDIFSFLEKRLGREKGVVEDSIPTPSRVLIHRQTPVIVFITDGYIYWNSKLCKPLLEQPCKCLDENRVKNYRNAYNSWRKEEGNANFDFEHFLSMGKVGGLEPFDNPNLKDAIFVVLELEDRSVKASGSTNYEPTDMVIVQAVWKKWLQDSGAKKQNIHFLTTEESVEDIQTFLEEVLV